MTFTPIVERPRGEHGRVRLLDWVLAVIAERDGSGCRDWPGYCNPKGYGQMGHEGRIRQVGHVVLELSGRPRPQGAQQLHSCDRPTCAAPWHLHWGTNLENRAEMVQRGRTSKGEHRPLAKLTEKAVREIRTRNATLAALAEKFGVGLPTVQKARVGDTWRHVRVDESGTCGVVIEDGQVAS